MNVICFSNEYRLPIFSGGTVHQLHFTSPRNICQKILRGRRQGSRQDKRKVRTSQIVKNIFF